MIRSLLAFLLVALASVSPSVVAAQQDSFRVLAFYTDKGEPDHIDFAKQALSFFAELAKKNDFHFEASVRWEDLSAEKLKNIQLVIWLNDFPKTAEQCSVFEHYMTH